MKLFLSKALNTTKISRDEAQEYFSYLQVYTDLIMKKDWGWYLKKGYYPIKAQKENAAEKDPKFSIHHHTSNVKGDHKPALHRFLQAKKASSNFVIARPGDIFYIVPIRNMSYHCVKRVWIPERLARSWNIERGWLNEPGLEVAGNGSRKLFSYEQFLSIICIQRYLNAYFPSMKRIFSHRKFSPTHRRNDPGMLYLLPLVEYSSFNDIDLKSKDFWLEDYRKNPIKTANNISDYMKEYDINENRDEWRKERRKIKIDETFV